VTTTSHIAAITLDESGIARRTAELDHERNVAMNDLIEWNHFAIVDADGPYRVTLSTSENRITFSITSETLVPPLLLAIPFAPFRGIIRDYVLICGSYFEAVRNGNIPRIEAIDMSRRGLHNEGADLLSNLLSDKVQMDSETARRLFTLLHVLHLK
jgi:uncharacterized protein (UPF0262 family)